jgi:hypothetical protein
MNRLYFYIIGFFAFLWFIVRSGSNPKRLAYPCQQAAFPLASAWMMAIAVPVGSSVYWELIEEFLLQKARLILMVILGFVIVNHLAIPSIKFATAPKIIKLGAYPVWTVENPVSNIFMVEDMMPVHGSLAAGDGTVHDSVLNDKGIDSLFYMMQTHGLYFHKTNSRPGGLIGKDDVVVIKANFQWRNRLSTNTDRIKGVIWQILNHPDGFDGEIIVADNGSEQIQPEAYFCGFSQYANNSHDTDQTIMDVVNVFKAKGYPVDWYVIDDLNNDIVSEYSALDFDDGYLYNSTTKVNYPKFKTPGGNYISFKYGVYDSVNAVYTNNLKLINMPVLKAHGITGATIAVKNWIGVMNQIHNSTWYGGYDQFHDNYVYHSFAVPARTLDETWPVLNIVDATWTAITDNWGYWNTFINTNTLLASTDPFAVSYYSAKHILKPIATRENNTDPDYAGPYTGDYGYYNIGLNHWYNWMTDHGSHTVTIDEAQFSVYNSLSDFQVPARPRFIRSVRGNYTRSIRGRPLYYETIED